jgi:hypothetical protein
MVKERQEEAAEDRRGMPRGKGKKVAELFGYR